MMHQSAVTIRRAKGDERTAIHDLVQRVVNEVYGFLRPSAPVPIGESDWENSWVALIAGEIVGVALTCHDSLDDLWIDPRHRGSGIGGALLLKAEEEIAARGFKTARLRVVSSNQAAIRFYRHLGWSTEREVLHERFSTSMTEMKKLAKNSEL